MGHGTCTCQGAAFEYTFNVEHELVKEGVRDRAEVIYLTNEEKLGDFGMDGMNFGHKGQVIPSSDFTESVFQERGVKAIMSAHVERVEPGVAHYEQVDGTKGEQAFDFAMLLPPFRGADLAAFDSDGADVTGDVFAPSGFMKVDADYTPKPYEEWKASRLAADLPVREVRQRLGRRHRLRPAAPDVATAHLAPTARSSHPAPPRTGMPSGVIGRAVAQTIAGRIKHGAGGQVHTASMADMGAACIASAGKGWRTGQAAAMTVFPIIPDKDKYGEAGRDINATYGELGLSAHWMKVMLHYLFIYKAKAHPLWHLIPEHAAVDWRVMSNVTTFPSARVPSAGGQGAQQPVHPGLAVRRAQHQDDRDGHQGPSLTSATGAVVSRRTRAGRACPRSAGCGTAGRSRGRSRRRTRSGCRSRCTAVPR